MFLLEDRESALPEEVQKQLKRIDEAAKAAKPRATDPVSIKGFLKEKFGDLNETVLSHAAACCCAACACCEGVCRACCACGTRRSACTRCSPSRNARCSAR